MVGEGFDEPEVEGGGGVDESGAHPASPPARVMLATIVMIPVPLRSPPRFMRPR